MTVEAIGSVLNTQSGSGTQRTAIQQEEFIRLFLAQLQFQDPLEPMDNREFLAQLAQFSSLEQSRQTATNTESMLVMQSASQALGLLNREVEVQGQGPLPVTGQVIAVQFTSNGPQLTVQSGAGQVLTGLRLSQISLVKP